MTAVTTPSARPLPAGPGTFGQRRWVTLGLVLPVAIASGFFAIGSISGIVDQTLTAAANAAFAILLVVMCVVSVRSALAGFIVADDYVRVRGVWATRTVPREDVAGFVLECDAAGRFAFPAVVATDGRRIRARWAFRRAGKDNARRVVQEIVDAFNRLGWYDEVRLDTALNAVDAVRRESATAYRWQSPPGWPEPPPGWQPMPGWHPPLDWPMPPPDWQYWRPLDIPVVVAGDVAVDADDVPSRGHLDTRYALDQEVAEGLPRSDWGMGEALQAFGWAALLIGLTVPVGVYLSDRISAFLGETAIGVAVVLAARKAAGQSGGWRRALGWELPKVRDAWFAFRWFGWNLLGRLIVGLLIAFITLPLHGKPQSNVDVSRRDSVLTVIFLVVVAVLIAPVVEEFFFRGLLLRAVMRRFRFWPAAIVSSVVFGLAHVPQVHSARARIVLGGSIAMFGLVQCLLVRRKGRLGPNMLVHGFANAIVVVLAVA